jgi:serine/threonine protein kinase
MNSKSFLERNPKIEKMNSEFEGGRHKKLSTRSFHQLKFLGKGAFGTVKQIKSNKTGKIYALKFLDKKDLIEEDMVEQFMKEGRASTPNNRSRDPDGVSTSQHCQVVRCLRG